MPSHAAALELHNTAPHHTSTMFTCAVLGLAACIVACQAQLPLTSNSLVYTQPAASQPVVHLAQGSLAGETTEYARVFRGVPYATPPVGALRWTSPVDPKPWGPSTLQATQDAPGCMQACDLPPHTCPPVISEDCLYLNVFTPHTNTTEENAAWPVFVFVHGGNFKQGYAGGPLYDGQRMANITNSVVVTIQYRLGSIGFLHTSEPGTAIKGNFGLEDQRKALHWVQRNIGAFGGDPSRVVLCGQSAGAMSVSTHLVQPRSRGLFHGAVMDSEPFALPFRDAKSFDLLSRTYATKLGCPTSGSEMQSCLIGKSAEDLMHVQVEIERNLLLDLSRPLDLFMPWTPTVGGDSEIVEQRIYSWQKKLDRPIPAIIGTVANEGVIFINQAFGKPIPTWEYKTALKAVFGIKNADKILAHYPIPENMTDIRVLMSEITTHGLFKCPVRNVSLAASAGRAEPLFIYHYTYYPALKDRKIIWGANFSACSAEVVCHGGELPFLFCPVEAPQLGIDLLPDEVELCSTMQHYWTSMAHGSPGSGNPSSPLTWEPRTADTEASMLLQAPQPNEMQHKAWAEICEFWDEIGYDFP
eukprot:m.144193 g.144193  ORF g.144193 m.144193 type:complete len:584 (+) comp17184_c0_seq4:50-1801(+)